MPKNETTLELKGDREIVITRMFNGPPRLVFEAWTKAEHVRRWWAPRSRNVRMLVCEADVVVGGRYRYVLEHEKNGPFSFYGKYLEIDAPSRLVYTQFFEPQANPSVTEPVPDDGGVVTTITFEARDDGRRTFMLSRDLAPSAEVRDGIIASGMEGGMRETMDLLDELVASLA